MMIIMLTQMWNIVIIITMIISVVALTISILILNIFTIIQLSSLLFS